MRILLIDDDMPILVNLQRGLRGMEISGKTIQDSDIVICHNPLGVEKALSVFRDDWPFDVVICDKNMPLVDGRQLLMKLAEEKTPTAWLLFTSMFSESDLDVCPLNTVPIPKPPRDFDEVVECIEKALSRVSHG
jgi:CheY-like chemotaxis protein